MKIHHFGYITDNLYTGGVELFSFLGFEKDGEIVTDKERNIKILFMKNDKIRIELIEPVDSESPFYPLLKKYKNTFYHICYVTNDIEEEIKVLRKKGFVQTTKILPAPAINNCNVVFLLHPKLGLIELLEENNEGVGISL